MARPPQGLALPLLHHQGKGLPLPRRHTPADSDRTAPQEEAQRELGRQTERKQLQTGRTVFFFFFCKLSKFLSKVEARGGGIRTIQAPALAFHHCEVL